jgi:hypothetical protein
VSSTALTEGLQNLVTTIAGLGGGAFFGTSASGGSLFTFAAGVLTLFGFAAILRALWRWGKSPLAESASVDVQLRELYVSYWAIVLLLVLAAFALTSLSEAPSPRYLIAAWVAAAALLGILAAAPLARPAVLVGVALFGALNLRSELAGGPAAAGPGPDPRLATMIERFATSYGARTGYSGYWDSHPVTWETHLRIKVFPVEPCVAPSGLCPDHLASIDTWYKPRAGIRSFLLTDERSHVPGVIRAPPPSLGRPLAKSPLGKGLTVSVYNYDIASAIGSTSTLTPTATSSPATEHAKPRGPQRVGRVCATPCTDGEGDYVDRLALVRNVETSDPSGVILSMRVQLTNAASTKIEADPSSLELIDSRQRTLQPVHPASARTRGIKTQVPQCPTESTVTLRPGESHTFHPCYELASREDMPRVLKLGEEEEEQIPLR